MINRTPRIALTLAVLLTGLLAHNSWAQSSSPASGDDTLKGPDVTARNDPQTAARSGFGPDSIERKKAAGKRPQPPLSMTEFMRSINILRSAPTPDATRLTPEEDTKIQSIASDFDTSLKSYMDKNKAEIDSLRAQLSPTDRAMLDQQLARIASNGGELHFSKAGFGGKKQLAKQHSKQPSSTDSSDNSSTSTQSTQTADAAKVRSRIAELYSNRPKPQDAQSKILGVLTPDQLTIVQEDLAKHEKSDDQSKHHRPSHAKSTPPASNT
jgi:hypothetical protein